MTLSDRNYITCRSKLTAATRYVEGLASVSVGQVQSKDIPLPDGLIHCISKSAQ